MLFFHIKTTVLTVKDNHTLAIAVFVCRDDKVAICAYFHVYVSGAYPASPDFL